MTHVDYSARVQTVSPDENPRFYSLLGAFEAQTGCAVLVNTSFNVRGEPPVCTPAEAFRCFMRTDMDFLVLETFFSINGRSSQMEPQMLRLRQKVLRQFLRALPAAS